MDGLTGRLARVAVLVVVASGLTSCGAGHSGGVPAFCALLPAADLARIGNLSGQVSVSSRSPQECDYGGNEAIIGEEATDRTTFDKPRGNETCTPEVGLGEAAYACMEKPDFLVVHFYSHGLAILVQINIIGPGQPENTRSLARFAATRL